MIFKKVKKNKMTYNTTLKKRSKMKRIMNIFLTQCTTADSNAIVIDADSLMSSKTLIRCGLTPENIIVLNNNKDIIKKAYKQGHINSVVGISTSVLPYLPGLYDLIYLDYCGTPAANKNGYWNPHMDVLWSADRLTENGVVIVTFTTGHIDNAIQRANLMIPNSLTLVKEVSYCETTPMYVMILSKSPDVKPLRDRFNLIYTKVKNHKSKLVQQMTIGKKRKTPKAKAPKQVRVIWGPDRRKNYKQYVGKSFYGSIIGKGKKGWIVAWDNEEGTTDVPASWIKTSIKL